MVKYETSNYQDGFYFYFDWPVDVAPGVSVPVEMAAWIEPDESVGNTDWYVARLEVAATGQEITKDVPVAISMSAHVSREYEGQVNIRWQEWLSDRPRKRGRAF